MRLLAQLVAFLWVNVLAATALAQTSDYRGVMATFRAMLAQEQELFSTLHWIDDDTIDTGSVISVQGHTRNAIGCYLSNTLSLYPAGCRAIINAVNALEDGEDLPNLASGGPGNYYSFPDEETIRDFLSTGYQWGGAKFLSELYSRYLPPIPSPEHS